MPFLRFSRDRRGYETTALMHAFRRRGRTQPRILYWFRTPPDTRVGRTPLDEDAIRLIEENHPDLEFDWPRILEISPEPAAEWTATASPRSPAGHRRRTPAFGPVTEPAPIVLPPNREAARTDREDLEPASRRAGTATPERTAEASGGAIEQAPQGKRRRRRRKKDGDPAGVGLPFADVPPEPGAPAVAGDSDAVDTAGLEADIEPPPPATAPPRALAAEAAFSPEDLARLRGRHAALLARIDQEIPDVDRAGTLRERAEALNPDTWVTADDVRQALENYEQVYRELRDSLGRRPPRRRTRSRGERHEPDPTEKAPGSEEE